jgi:hypothetical protein
MRDGAIGARVRVRIEVLQSAGRFAVLETFERVEQAARLTLGAGVADRGVERGVADELGLASWLLGTISHSIQRRTRVPELRLRLRFRFRFAVAHCPETPCFVCNHTSDQPLLRGDYGGFDILL